MLHLKTIVIPDMVQRIEDCGHIESVIMGKGVSYIGTQALAGSDLQSVYLNDPFEWYSAGAAPVYSITFGKGLPEDNAALLNKYHYYALTTAA